jgi:hypothetical protein
MPDLEVPESLHIETPVEETQTEHQPSERELTMRAIAERAEERRQAEIAKGREYDEDARQAGLSFDMYNDPPEEDAPPAPAEAPAQAASEPEPNAPAMRKVTFDGREWEVTDAQYEELARMGMLANAALHQYQYQQPAPQPQYQPAQQQQQPLVDPELVRATVRKIQYGAEDDGADALTQLVTHVVSRVPQAPHVDQNAIIQQAAAVAQQQAQFARDQELIRREYGDTIFNDPQRTMLARLNVDAIRQRNAVAGINKSDIEVFREAGNLVLDALNLPRPNSDETKQPAPQAAPVASARADVVERKRAAPKTITQIDRRAPTPATPRAPTNSEIVDQMRRARGQVSMM